MLKNIPNIFLISGDGGRHHQIWLNIFLKLNASRMIFFFLWHRSIDTSASWSLCQHGLKLMVDIEQLVRCWVILSMPDPILVIHNNAEALDAIGIFGDIETF